MPSKSRDCSKAAPTSCLSRPYSIRSMPKRPSTPLTASLNARVARCPSWFQERWPMPAGVPCRGRPSRRSALRSLTPACSPWDSTAPTEPNSCSTTWNGWPPSHRCASQPTRTPVCPTSWAATTKHPPCSPKMSASICGADWSTSSADVAARRRPTSSNCRKSSDATPRARCPSRVTKRY